MTCTLKDSPEDKPKETFILKYINLNELTKNKAAGSEREAKLMSRLQERNARDVRASHARCGSR